MKRIALPLIALFTAALAACTAIAPVAPASTGSWNFAAMGDTPYSDAEEDLLRPMIQRMNGENLAFVAHVGDIVNGRGGCANAVFEERKELFQGFRHPFVLVPGDNDWTDCHRGGFDPLDRLDFFRHLFAAGDDSLGQRSIRLERQSNLDPRYREYAENLRWQVKGVLFVGLNIPGSNNNLGRTPEMDEEYRRRMAANFDWLDEAVKRTESPELSALVIFVQANPYFTGRTRRASLNDGFDTLRKALAVHAGWLKKPILFVHGDTHSFRVDQPLIDAATGRPFPNFTRLEVDGSPWVGWVRVNVDPSKPGLFSFQRVN
jgi:hypothetical protein